MGCDTYKKILTLYGVKIDVMCQYRNKWGTVCHGIYDFDMCIKKN